MAKQDPRYDEVRNGLLEQLARNGTVGKYYIDMVEDYMRLWEIKTRLQADVRKRGAKVKVVTASSVNIKTNDSVLDLLKVNAQMLKILENLGLQPAGQNTGNTGGGDGDRM
jgi:Phage terminase, small subunit.